MPLVPNSQKIDPFFKVILVDIGLYVSSVRGTVPYPFFKVIIVDRILVVIGTYTGFSPNIRSSLLIIKKK